MAHDSIAVNMTDADFTTIKKAMWKVDDANMAYVARRYPRFKKPSVGYYEQGWHCLVHDRGQAVSIGGKVEIDNNSGLF
jgi:hypothetical protein